MYLQLVFEPARKLSRFYQSSLLNPMGERETVSGPQPRSSSHHRRDHRCFTQSVRGRAARKNQRWVPRTKIPHTNRKGEEALGYRYASEHKGRPLELEDRRLSRGRIPLPLSPQCSLSKYQKQYYHYRVQLPLARRRHLAFSETNRRVALQIRPPRLVRGLSPRVPVTPCTHQYRQLLSRESSVVSPHHCRPI